MRIPTLAAALIVLSACAVGPQGQPSGTNGQPGATDRNSAAQTAKAKVSARQLLGQNDTWLLEHLGEPAFKRADREANIWQYKNGACMLNVFLYADETAANAPKQVLHFDARDARGDNTDREHCLEALQE